MQREFQSFVVVVDSELKKTNLMKSTCNVVKRLLTFAPKTEILKKKDDTLHNRKVSVSRKPLAS